MSAFAIPCSSALLNYRAWLKKKDLTTQVRKVASRSSSSPAVAEACIGVVDVVTVDRLMLQPCRPRGALDSYGVKHAIISSTQESTIPSSTRWFLLPAMHETHEVRACAALKPRKGGDGLCSKLQHLFAVYAPRHAWPGIEAIAHGCDWHFETDT